MFGKLISWFFGGLLLTVGILNIVFGNDADFGVFLLLLALLYFPPVTNYIKKQFGFTLPVWIKMVLAIFSIWANLAVGAIAEGFLF